LLDIEKLQVPGLHFSSSAVRLTCQYGLQGVRLHALVDACDSANLLDLPYQLMVRDNQTKVQQTHPGLTQLEAEDLKVGSEHGAPCIQLH
jgi:hypothetical protein